jgi:stage II sporulation protein AA (anti-sigma F factor antagonist)
VAAAPAFEIEVREVEGIAVVAPAGQLDSKAAPEFEKATLRALTRTTREAVFDLARVDYIASAGLRVVIMAGKRLQAEGGQLVLCALNPSVRQVFEVAGFVKLFPIHRDRAEAIAALQSGARDARVRHLAGDLLHRGRGTGHMPRTPILNAADPDRVALAAEILRREPGR